jgi:Glycosyl transferase family 11
MQIVIRQISGLGNQLFQYAAGLYYAKRFGATMRLAVDLPSRSVSHGYARPFLLPHFSVDVEMPFLSKEERMLFSPRPQLQPLITLHKRLKHIQVYSEPLNRRYTLIDDIPVDPATRWLYLVGYWQTYRMVEAVEKDVRSHLRLRLPPAGRNADYLSQIEGCICPVSLHIRRGDYTLAAEGNIALSLSYYLAGIRFMQDHFADLTFFVFSDDIPWARAHMPNGLKVIFVEGNGDAGSHEDLRLMSACRHHIIANSSFSWWGAWLNPYSDKLVYAPKNWLLRPESYYPDLFPPTWTLDSLSHG